MYNYPEYLRQILRVSMILDSSLLLFSLHPDAGDSKWLRDDNNIGDLYPSPREHELPFSSTGSLAGRKGSTSGRQAINSFNSFLSNSIYERPVEFRKINPVSINDEDELGWTLSYWLRSPSGLLELMSPFPNGVVFMPTNQGKNNRLYCKYIYNRSRDVRGECVTEAATDSTIADFISENWKLITPPHNRFLSSEKCAIKLRGRGQINQSQFSKELADKMRHRANKTRRPCLLPRLNPQPKNELTQTQPTMYVRIIRESKLTLNSLTLIDVAPNTAEFSFIVGYHSANSDAASSMTRNAAMPKDAVIRVTAGPDRPACGRSEWRKEFLHFGNKRKRLAAKEGTTGRAPSMHDDERARHLSDFRRSGHIVNRIKCSRKLTPVHDER